MLAATPPQSSEAADFKDELVRHRKPAPKPQSAEESGRKTAAKPTRSAKASKSKTAATKRATGRASEQDAENNDAGAADVTKAPQPSATEAAEPYTVEDEKRPTDQLPEAKSDPADATPDLALAAVVATPASSTAAAPDPEQQDPDAPPAPAVTSELSAELPQPTESSEAPAQTAGEVDPEETGEAAPEGTSAKTAAPIRKTPSLSDGQPAPGGATVAERDDGEGAATGHGSGESQARMSQWDRGFVEQAAPELVDDSTTPDVAPAGRAGAVRPPEVASIDLSIKHVGAGGVIAAHSVSPDDALPPEQRFAAANHENIVKGMRAEVLPNGGSMRIRLDPPQLGALQVTVQMRDGLVTASFETSSDEATKLLGHSLNQLKSVLESHGVAVDKLQVQQAPRDERPGTAREDPSQHRNQGNHDQDHAARQEQQRREMLRRMWRRLSGFPDPLDMTG